MLASEIPAYETTAYDRMVARGELSSGEENGVPVLDYAPNGRYGYFYKQTKKKRRIVLHFTMGYLGGDLSTLTKKNNHVSVSFVIARDGKIYRLFDTKYWSYHLGPGTIGGNKACSSSSVGIEISNIGPLDKVGNWIWNDYGSKYCRITENQYYESGQEFRNFSNYATFTDAQYAAANNLLTALCTKHDIPRTFLPTSKRFKPFSSPQNGRGYRGICSHVNYRATGKTDIGPIFDWSKLGA